MANNSYIYIYIGDYSLTNDLAQSRDVLLLSVNFKAELYNPSDAKSQKLITVVIQFHTVNIEK